MFDDRTTDANWSLLVEETYQIASRTTDVTRHACHITTDISLLSASQATDSTPSEACNTDQRKWVAQTEVIFLANWNRLLRYGYRWPS